LTTAKHFPVGLAFLEKVPRAKDGSVGSDQQKKGTAKHAAERLKGERKVGRRRKV